jgi:hypothetical protein
VSSETSTSRAKKDLIWIHESTTFVTQRAWKRRKKSKKEVQKLKTAFDSRRRFVRGKEDHITAKTLSTNKMDAGSFLGTLAFALAYYKVSIFAFSHFSFSDFRTDAVLTLRDKRL